MNIREADAEGQRRSQAARYEADRQRVRATQEYWHLLRLAGLGEKLTDQLLRDYHQSMLDLIAKEKGKDE